MTVKTSSVVEDDVQDDGIRAGAVVPLPMLARMKEGFDSIIQAKPDSTTGGYA